MIVIVIHLITSLIVHYFEFTYSIQTISHSTDKEDIFTEI